MGAAANAFGWDVVCTGETPLPDRLGRPDYAVHLNQLLAGYVELKAVGTGATASLFKGHNREQFKRFSAIPNILYTDGNEWALYRNGELVPTRLFVSRAMSPCEGKEGDRATGRARARKPVARFPDVAALHSNRQQGPHRPSALCCVAGSPVPHAARRRDRRAQATRIRPSCNSRRIGANCYSPTRPTNASPTPTPKPSSSRCCWAAARGPTRSRSAAP